MKKGDIIRKQLHDGTYIGPFMQVLGVIGNMAAVYVLQGSKKNTHVVRKNYGVYRMAKVELTSSVYERIDRGSVHSVIHDATITWQKIIDNRAEIISIRDTRSSSNRMIFKIDRTTELYYDGVRCVRVWLGERIL